MSPAAEQGRRDLITGLSFEGCVDLLPPLKDKEIMILSQIFTEPVADAYRQELQRWLDGKLGEDLVDMEANDQPPAERTVAIRKVKEWVKKGLKQKPTVSGVDLKEFNRQVLTNLPEDPPVSPFMKPTRVSQDDPRKELRGAMGCHAHNESGKAGDVVFKKWDVLGCYRSMMMFTQGYRDYKTQPHPKFPDLMPEWKNKCDSYGVDMKFVSHTQLPKVESDAPEPIAHAPMKGDAAAAVAPVSKKRQAVAAAVPKKAAKRGKTSGRGGRGKKAAAAQQEDDQEEDDPIPLESLQEYEIIASAWMVGNETCLVNDPVIDPMNRETYSSEMGNCSVIIFRVGPWSYPIMVALRDIYQDEELRYCYGSSYWETFADQLLDIHYSRRQEEEKRKTEAAMAEMQAAYQNQLAMLRERLASGDPAAAAELPSPPSMLLLQGPAEEAPPTPPTLAASPPAQLAVKLPAPVATKPPPQPAARCHQPRRAVKQPGPPKPPKKYKGVFAREGLWDAVFVKDGAVFKLGEYVCPRHAAVVVDLQRIALGQPPVNFPKATQQALLKLKAKMRKKAAAAREEAEAREAQLEVAATATQGSGGDQHADSTAGASEVHPSGSNLALTVPARGTAGRSGFNIRELAGHAFIPAPRLAASGGGKPATPKLGLEAGLSRKAPSDALPDQDAMECSPGVEDREPSPAAAVPAEDSFVDLVMDSPGNDRADASSGGVEVIEVEDGGTPSSPLVVRPPSRPAESQVRGDPPGDVPAAEQQGQERKKRKRQEALQAQPTEPPPAISGPSPSQKKAASETASALEGRKAAQSKQAASKPGLGAVAAQNSSGNAPSGSASKNSKAAAVAARSSGGDAASIPRKRPKRDGAASKARKGDSGTPSQKASKADTGSKHSNAQNDKMQAWGAQQERSAQRRTPKDPEVLTKGVEAWQEGGQEGGQDATGLPTSPALGANPSTAAEAGGSAANEKRKRTDRFKDFFSSAPVVSEQSLASMDPLQVSGAGKDALVPGGGGTSTPLSPSKRHNNSTEQNGQNADGGSQPPSAKRQKEAKSNSGSASLSLPPGFGTPNVLPSTAPAASAAGAPELAVEAREATSHPRDLPRRKSDKQRREGKLAGRSSSKGSDRGRKSADRGPKPSATQKSKPPAGNAEKESSRNHLTGGASLPNGKAAGVGAHEDAAGATVFTEWELLKRPSSRPAVPSAQPAGLSRGESLPDARAQPIGGATSLGLINGEGPAKDAPAMGTAANAGLNGRGAPPQDTHAQATGSAGAVANPGAAANPGAGGRDLAPAPAILNSKPPFSMKFNIKLPGKGSAALVKAGSLERQPSGLGTPQPTSKPAAGALEKQPSGLGNSLAAKPATGASEKQPSGQEKQPTTKPAGGTLEKQPSGLGNSLAAKPATGGSEKQPSGQGKPPASTPPAVSLEKQPSGLGKPLATKPATGGSEKQSYGQGKPPASTPTAGGLEKQNSGLGKPLATKPGAAGSEQQPAGLGKHLTPKPTAGGPVRQPSGLGTSLNAKPAAGSLEKKPSGQGKAPNVTATAGGLEKRPSGQGKSLAAKPAAGGSAKQPSGLGKALSRPAGGGSRKSGGDKQPRSGATSPSRVNPAGSPGRRRESDNLPEPQPVGRAGEFIERVRSANGPKSPKRPEAAGSTPTLTSALLEAAQRQQPNGLASAWPNGVAGELEQSQQAKETAPKQAAAAPSEPKATSSQTTSEAPSSAAASTSKPGQAFATPKLPTRPAAKARQPSKQTARKSTTASLAAATSTKPPAAPAATPATASAARDGVEGSMPTATPAARANPRSPVTRIESPPLKLAPLESLAPSGSQPEPEAAAGMPPGRWGKKALESPPLQAKPKARPVDPPPLLEPHVVAAKALDARPGSGGAPPLADDLDEDDYFKTCSFSQVMGHAQGRNETVRVLVEQSRAQARGLAAPLNGHAATSLPSRDPRMNQVEARGTTAQHLEAAHHSHSHPEPAPPLPPLPPPEPSEAEPPGPRDSRWEPLNPPMPPEPAGHVEAAQAPTLEEAPKPKSPLRFWQEAEPTTSVLAPLAELHKPPPPPPEPCTNSAGASADMDWSRGEAGGQPPLPPSSPSDAGGRYSPSPLPIATEAPPAYEDAYQPTQFGLGAECRPPWQTQAGAQGSGGQPFQAVAGGAGSSLQALVPAWGGYSQAGTQVSPVQYSSPPGVQQPPAWEGTDPFPGTSHLPHAVQPAAPWLTHRR